jgi:nucleotide sugar dehydrogenase
MKIGIIGLGVIGTACRYGFEKLGHNIKIHDIKMGTSIDDVIDTEINFICVPTPSKDNGSCDTSIVESVVYELKTKNYSGVIAIKSTVSPTTTEKLIKETGLKICFVPEFLRERCAISDFTENHDILAVGSENEDICEIVKKCHGHYPKSYVKLKPTEAELLKYYSNVFNAMKITFANEMYEICKFLNVDYTIIKDSFIKRGTTKDVYLDVNDNFRGYAGVCLPKDTKALDFFIKSQNLDLKLFETINNENDKFKKTVFNGMRLN